MESTHKSKKRRVNPVLYYLILITIGLFCIVIFTSGSSNTSGNTSTSSSSANTSNTTTPSISMSEIEFSNLQLGCQPISLEGGGIYPDCNNGKFQILGQVTNNSPYGFVGVSLTVDAYDCPTTVINSSCSHIGQDTFADLLVNGNAEALFPPDQTREGYAMVNLSGLPPIQGNFEWQYTVTGFWNGFEELPVTQ